MTTTNTTKIEEMTKLYKKEMEKYFKPNGSKTYPQKNPIDSKMVVRFVYNNPQRF